MSGGKTNGLFQRWSFAFGLALISASSVRADTVYLAPDDHTDFIWSATEAEYEAYFVDMLDYYVGRADADIASNVPSAQQSRFTADGSYWLWVYQKKRGAEALGHVVDRIKSGHLNVNMPPLDIMHGTMPAEAVLRQMYFAGSLERKYDVRFQMAGVMENQALTYGVGSLWAGAGAKYTWNGVCGCASSVPYNTPRAAEIYRWRGPDGSSLLMKWFSFNGNESLGGYAEARTPSSAADYLLTNPSFGDRYRPSGGPKYTLSAAFGQGWDDRQTKNVLIQDFAKSKSGVVVSNEVDFFEAFAVAYGDKVPARGESYGIEWDMAAASIAEVSASVKRSVERLRAAEGLAALVTLVEPAAFDTKRDARDLAQLNMGLYFEHDLGPGGPGATSQERLAFQRRVAKQVQTYVDDLYDDARARLGSLIKKSGAADRFFVYNPLGWDRTDVADFEYAGPGPLRVVEVGSQSEVPSQLVVREGKAYVRIVAADVPAVGYKVYEVRKEAPTIVGGGPVADANQGTLSNAAVALVVAPRGAITSYKDLTRSGRELAKGALNDLGAGGGTLAIENAGPVSATVVATSTAPLAHTSRVTLTRVGARVEVENTITQNFGDERGYTFALNLASPDTWHEEVGAVIRAKLTDAGGHYAKQNARYDHLPINHFVDLSEGTSIGVTLSNADAFIMRLGNSTVTTLDTTTPSVTITAGARPVSGSDPLGFPNQGGDARFVHRFALGAHGAFVAADAMKFSLEHQNPFATAAVTGGTVYPEDRYGLLAVSDPNVLLWSVKPAQDGAAAGIVTRVWNLSPAASADAKITFARVIARAQAVTHIETPIGDAAFESATLRTPVEASQLKTFLTVLGEGVGGGVGEIPLMPGEQPGTPVETGASQGGCGCVVAGKRESRRGAWWVAIFAFAGITRHVRRRRKRV